MLGVFVLLGGGNDDFCAEFGVSVVRAPTVPVKLLVEQVNVAGARFFHVDVSVLFEELNSVREGSTAIAEAFLHDLVRADNGVIVVHVRGKKIHDAVSDGRLFHEPETRFLCLFVVVELSPFFEGRFFSRVCL